jgi:hypothetical protein
MAVLVGCAQSGQTNQQTTRRVGQSRAAQHSSAAKPAVAPISPVAAMLNPMGAATDAAIGAATAILAGATDGTVNLAGTRPAATRGPRIKPDGKGGYDASELQADAIRRAHLMSQRYGVTKVTRARNGVLAGQPSTQPSTQPTGR